MADNKTADQWRAAANSTQNKLTTLDAAYSKLPGDLATVNQLISSAQSTLLAAKNAEIASANIPGERFEASRRVLAAQNNLINLEYKQDQLTNLQNQYIVRRGELQSEINFANEQAEKATDSPIGTIANPTTSSVPPPGDSASSNITETVVPLGPISDPNIITAQPGDIPVQFEPPSGPTLGTPTPTVGGANDIREPQIVRTAGVTPTPVDPTQDDAEIERQADFNRVYSPITQPTVDEFGDLAGAIDRNNFDDIARAEARQLDPAASSNLVGQTQAARSSNQTIEITAAKWTDDRFRISLAPGSNYLYKAPKPGILLPLQSTGGVLFPYTPQITVTYSASYDQFDLTHSNYKPVNYKNSMVDTINIVSNFTAQDTNEANYLLAVIHFFRSVTKMFYGLDQNPIAGMPPPLCYLKGFGPYAFNNHPVVITSFNLTWPDDVDYINAGDVSAAGVNLIGGQSASLTIDRSTPDNSFSARLSALARGGIGAGATRAPPQFTSPGFQLLSGDSSQPITRVPTKVNLQLNAMPVVSRLDVSTKFSLEKYATGELLKKGFW